MYDMYPVALRSDCIVLLCRSTLESMRYKRMLAGVSILHNDQILVAGTANQLCSLRAASGAALLAHPPHSTTFYCVNQVEQNGQPHMVIMDMTRDDGPLDHLTAVRYMTSKLVNGEPLVG
jgi:hypothetical protein